MAGMTTETDISYAAFESLPDVETTMDSVSSMDDSTMNMLETLRYLPDHTAPNKKLSYTQTPVFFGTLEMQLPTSFNFVAGCAWETSHVEVSNNVLYYRPRQEDTSNTGAFRIAFLLPSEYSIADASKEGGDDDKLPAHDADYKVYLEFETAAHVIKIMTNDQIVILKCPDEPTKAAFVRAVETDLRRLLGDDLWQEKTQAAVQAMPMLRDQFYVLEQRRLRMRQVLSDAGLVAMDVSLQKSFSKLITGHLEMVAPTDADRRGRTYWFVLHDQSLYWFENESADEPISFFNMNLATVALVVDEIRKGRFMLSIQTALRSIELRMPHAIALCEWMAAIEAVLIRCRQEKLERERRRSSSFNRRPHAKRMSTFTKLIRGGNGKLLNTPTEEPLLENDPVTFKHESQSDRSLRIFEAIASMRESGYTVDELMARPNGRKLFLTFLRDTSRLALSQIMAACVQFQDESVDDEQRPALLHDLYKRFFARDALTPLAGADPAAIASYLMKAASSGTPIHADVLEPVWDWLRATMQGCFEELRRTKPFHHYMKCELASAELPIDPKQASFPNDIELEMPSLVLTLPSSSTTGHQHPPITVGFPHELNTLTIGRDYSCDVLVQESADVSRSHARFGYTRTNVDVFDLGSSSGTFVNGSRVHYAPVSLNDTVRIGNMTFVLRLSHVEPKQNIGQKIVNTFRRLSLKLSGTAATSPAPQSQ